MSLLQETIVYLWLVPVVTQIFIPLAMLIGWSGKEVRNSQFHKNVATETVVRKEQELLVSAA